MAAPAQKKLLALDTNLLFGPEGGFNDGLILAETALAGTH